MMETPTLSKLLMQDTELVTLPVVVNTVLDLLNDPDSSTNKIVEQIEGDQALSARVLRLVNSPYYGLPASIDSVQQAVSMIGLNALRDLVISTAVQEKFSHLPSNVIDVKSFWENSLVCASLAREIGRKFKIKNSSLFTAALLHNIGSMVLFQHLPQAMMAILQEVKTSGQPLHVVERDILGYDHADVGAALMEQWELPDIFVQVAKYHNTFYEAESYQMEISAVHLADTVAHQIQPQLNMKNLPVSPDLAVYEYVPIDDESLESMQGELNKRMQ